MQKLRFYARGSAMVCVPDERRIVGNRAEYVGREFVSTDGGHAYPARNAAFECSGAQAARLAKITARDAALWPADEATAQACGVPFVDVEWRSGEWLPRQASSKSASSKREKD